MRKQVRFRERDRVGGVKKRNEWMRVRDRMKPEENEFLICKTFGLVAMIKFTKIYRFMPITTI